jgi:hypothetical protein
MQKNIFFKYQQSCIYIILLIVNEMFIIIISSFYFDANLIF